MTTTLPKNPRFETYRDAKGEYRWRLRAHNGLIVADSAEGYAKKGNAIRAAETVRGLVRRSGAPIPIVHWEPGEKDKGGRPKGAAPSKGPRPAGAEDDEYFKNVGEAIKKGLGPMAAKLAQGGV